MSVKKAKEMLEKKMELLSQQNPTDLGELIAVSHAMVEIIAILLRMEEQTRWRSSWGRRSGQVSQQLEAKN